MPKKKSENQPSTEGGEPTTTRRPRGPESEAVRIAKIDEIAAGATVTFRADLIELLEKEPDPESAAQHALVRAKDMLRVAKLAKGMGDIAKGRLTRLLRSYDADPNVAAQ